VETECDSCAFCVRSRIRPARFSVEPITSQSQAEYGRPHHRYWSGVDRRSRFVESPVDDREPVFNLVAGGI